MTLEYAQEGVTFQMYQVGQRMEDGSLELTGDFTDYSVDLSQDDWLDTAATLAALAARDQLPADASGVVSDGTMTFSQLGKRNLPGGGDSPIPRGGFYYTPVPLFSGAFRPGDHRSGKNSTRRKRNNLWPTL